MMRVLFPVCLLCATPSASAALTRLYLSVNVNGTPAVGFLPVSTDGQQFLMSAGDLRTLRIPVAENLPDAQPVSLEHLPGLAWRYSEPSQSLTLTFPPARLRSLLISPEVARPEVAAPDGLPAQILDYSVRHIWQPGFQQVSGSGALRMSSGDSSLSNGFLFNDHPVWQGASWVRLNTSWQTVDMVQARQFTLGDTVLQAPGWGTGIRMAGVQWGSLQSLRPDIVTTPLPQFSAQAVLPSTLDVYVDRQKVFSRQIPSGPFDVQMQPGVSGSEVTLVTRDATGAEQVTTQAWYYTPALLAPGLSEFSVESGVPRSGFGLRSAQYDTQSVFVAGTLRRGMNRQTTLSLNGQTMADGLWLGGGGIATTTGPWGVFSLDAAVSRWRNSTGGVVMAGLEGRLLGSVTASTSLMRTTGAFSDIGRVAAVRAIRRAGQVVTGATGALADEVIRAGALAPLWSGGPAVGVNWSRMRWETESREQVSASLSGGLTLRTGYYLSVWQDVHRRDQGVFLSFRYTPDSGFSAVTDMAREAGTDSLVQTFSGQPDNATGRPGWDLSTTRDSRGNSLASGGMQWRTAPASLAARVGSGPCPWTSLSASGSLVMAQGEVFTASDNQDSYAIVTDAGPHGRVLLGGVVAGEANEQGRLLVTGLRPGVARSLYLDTRTLPVDWVAQSTEQQAVAPWRGVTRVAFGARQVRAVTLSLTDGQQRPLPPGYPVNLNGRTVTVTGYDGEVWLEGITGENVIRVDAPDGRACTAHYTMPAGEAGNRRGRATCRW